MSTNNHAQIRYHALDRCFSNFGRRYYIEDLVKECCEAIYNFKGIRDGAHRRQVMKDIAFMESPEGWDAPIARHKDGRRVYYRYDDKNFTINKRPLSQTEMAQLKETIFMLNRFKGMPQFEWMEELLSNLEDKFRLKGQKRNVIGFDQNPYYEGAKYLSDLFNAIVNRQTLHIDYRKFNGDIRNFVIHPYFIKQYNNRWFLLGLNHSLNVITNIPLDRITSIKVAQEKYVDSEIEWNEYFEDVIGVTITDEDPQTIVLRFSQKQYPYIKSKPIHGSMKIVSDDEGTVSIKVIPNYELEAMIGSFSNDVEILSPQWLRDKIGEKYKELAEKYSK